MIKIAILILVLAKIYQFIPPQIPSAGVYYFNTDSDVRYEVRFGRKKDDILSVSIVFGVLNEEFDGEEYVMTNRGEFYSVMATIESIIGHFHLHNPNIRSFEFAGEPANAEKKVIGATKRTKVYLRYAKRIFSAEGWDIQLDGNKVFIRRRN